MMGRSKWASVTALCLVWGVAIAPLAIGPFLGVWAMARERAHPDSLRLAGGRR